MNSNSNDQSSSYYQTQKRESTPAVVGEKGQQEVVSWIVKMLHDKSFLSYVHKIENYINETEDGMEILKGLEQAELSST